jgi:hypothetical protein
MNTKPTETVTRRDAARLTGLSPNTLKRWAVEGRGPAFAKLGTAQQSRTLYSVAEIEQWKRDPAGYNWPAAKRRTKNERHR